MKAVAIFPHRRALELIEVEPPRLMRPADVLLRMLDVGICGTDKEIAGFHYGTSPQGSDYLIMGHESLGEVIEVGRDVSGLEPGDLVVPTVRRPCAQSTCRACRSGQQDFCSTGEFTERGIKEAHGYLAELVVEQKTYLHKIPAALRSVGVLIEPLTIAEKAFRQVWDVQERLPWAAPQPSHSGVGEKHGHDALVLGAGPVGILGAMLLVSLGFDTYVYSREPTDGVKAAIVEAAGAHYISAADHDVADLPRLVDDIDLVYEACGATGLAFGVLQLLAPNAVFVFTGVPGRKAPIEIDAAELMRNLVLKNQIVFGTVNAGPFAFENAIKDLERFLETAPKAVEGLITGRYPLEAYADLLSGNVHGIKNVVALHPPESKA